MPVSIAIRRPAPRRAAAPRCRRFRSRKSIRGRRSPRRHPKSYARDRPRRAAGRSSHLESSGEERDLPRKNTTSVYTAAKIFPMLPEKLSTNLTSLNENEDCVAMIIDIAVDADGSVTSGEVYRAKVRNGAKLAYNSLGMWLEGKGAP